MPCSIDKLVSSDRLPSLPAVALRVVELARESEPDFGEICQVIRSDPALAGKMIKTVNSALFGLSGQVSSIELAVSKLGINLVRSLVLSFSLAEESSRTPDPYGTLKQFWQAALSQAVFAEALAERDPDNDPAVFFLGGLLQSIGILAFLRIVPEEYETHVVETSSFPCVAASERRYFGFTHVEVGEQIWKRWGLPSDVVHAMATHQSFIEPDDTPNGRELATALQAANLFSRYLATAHRHGHRRLDLFSCFLHERYGIESCQTEALIKEACHRIEETAALFDFDLGRPIPIRRILEEAQHILADIALQSQLPAVPQEFAGGVQSSRPTWRHGRELALCDDRTGTFHRSALQQFFRNRVRRFITTQQAIGLLHVDIDKFRRINDELGGDAGERVIQSVAEIALQAVRKADYVFRYATDQFLIVLVGASEDQLSRVAHQICSDSRKGVILDGINTAAAVSVGGIYYRPAQDDPLDASWLIQDVEQAMLEAKRSGGDQIRTYRCSGQIAREAI